jgi:hypothetical protein
LAYQYTNLDPSVSKWFFENQGAIQKGMFGGDLNKYNAWINNSSYNAQAPNAEATNRLRGMAGLKAIDAWRFGGAPAPSRPQAPPMGGGLPALPPGQSYAAHMTPTGGAGAISQAVASLYNQGGFGGLFGGIK